jgi:hypothetical protein
MRRTVLKIIMYGLSAALIGIAGFMVVGAARLWLEYADPDPALAEEVGRAIALSVPGDAGQGAVDLGAALGGEWAALSLLPARMTQQEITACLGQDWDKAAAAADILAGDTALAVVLTGPDGVARASWGPELGARLTWAGEICAVPRADARFNVEARRVEPGPGETWGAFTVYHLSQPVGQ